MKDPYVFDFIPFREDMLERDIEQALVRDVTKLLLELGTGFAFLGNQYHLNVGGDDFYIDLLFYNLNLRCYVVVELKTGEFKPEYAGQLNFYLSAVDGILKKNVDNPSIGLLLCKSKNNLVAEYSLKDISKPIGVSEYKVTSNLTGELEKQLPSVEDIQNRIKWAFLKFVKSIFTVCSYRVYLHFDHHLTTTVQSHTKMPKKPVVMTNNRLFLVSSATVQNQQNLRFSDGLYRPVAVLRLNTYFQLRYFIFCTTKIAVLSFVFLGMLFDFFISIEGRFLRCWTTTLERCSTQLNFF